MHRYTIPIPVTAVTNDNNCQLTCSKWLKNTIFSREILSVADCLALSYNCQQFAFLISVKMPFT